MTKLSRRKYGDLIRFLRSVIKNDKTSLRVRMQAAERLDGIYARHEAPELKRLEREARAEHRTFPGAPDTQEPEEQSTRTPEEAERAAKEFLERMKQKETSINV